MDGEAPDQDRFRRSKWFTVKPREFITLGHVSIATGRRTARPGSFPSVVLLPTIRILLCVQFNTSPASFMHFFDGSSNKRNDVKVLLNDASNTAFRYGRFYSNLKSCIKLAGEILRELIGLQAVRYRSIARAKTTVSRSCRVVGPLVPLCSSFCHFKPLASYIQSIVVTFRCQAYDGNRILAVMAISVQYLHRYCCSLREGPLVYTQML